MTSATVTAPWWLAARDDALLHDPGSWSDCFRWAQEGLDADQERVLEEECGAFLTAAGRLVLKQHYYAVHDFKYPVDNPGALVLDESHFRGFVRGYLVAFEVARRSLDKA
jgi:hypothetical protein